MNIYSNASNLVQGVDTAFIIILSIIIFFLVGLTAVLIWFLYRYDKKRNPVATQIHGNNTVEVIWIIIPLLLVLGMFYFGWTGWKPFYTAPPDDSMNIKVISRMWNWVFEYENGRKTDTLYIPQGHPVALNMVSVDVIHSLYIPAFRVKQDIVPGRIITSWFIGNIPGEYDLFCAEYCGLNHSYMYTSVRVLPQEEFEKWYTDTTSVVVTTTDVSPAAQGKVIVQRYGCIACHSADGSKIIGPSFKGIYNKEITVISNGKERQITVDDEYIHSSIYDPNKDIVKGYSHGLMQSYTGLISDEETDMIIDYIKSLK